MAMSRIALVFLGMVILAGCTYRAGIDDPFSRKFTWFGYLDGDDIRPACVPGAPDRWRLVYNARWTEQVRAYDIVTGPGEASLTTRVFGPGGNVGMFDPFDPQGPWRATMRVVPLDPRDVAELRALITPALTPPPRDLALPSQGLYWLMNGCVDGRFRVGAWLHPSPSFEALAFPAALFRRDPTGIPVHRADPRGAATDFSDRMVPDERSPPSFELRVGENGLLGRVRLF
jgi:hypothetical protein